MMTEVPWLFIRLRMYFVVKFLYSLCNFTLSFEFFPYFSRNFICFKIINSLSMRWAANVSLVCIFFLLLYIVVAFMHIYFLYTWIYQHLHLYFWVYNCYVISDFKLQKFLLLFWQVHFLYMCKFLFGLMAHWQRILMPMQDTEVGSVPELEGSPGEGDTTHSCILAWKIPLTEEPAGLQSTWS